MLCFQFWFVIISDKSKFANDMNLQIATLKPLSKLDFILIDDKKFISKRFYFNQQKKWRSD